MAEEWRAIPGWEGLYEVSSHGRVRSLDRTVRMLGRWGFYDRFVDGKIIRQSKGNGLWMYQAVGLCRDGGQLRRLVHRLVCEAFHGPPPTPEHITAHCDGNHLNNHEDNLRWATHTENVADCVAHGRKARGEALSNSKLTDEAVREIRKAKGLTQYDLADRYGVAQSVIWSVLSGRTWKHVR